MNLQMKMMVRLIQDANTIAIVIVNTEQIMAATVKAYKMEQTQLKEAVHAPVS